MFTISADSSPQTAPTTPSSVEDSNNSDEYLQPASTDLWNNPYGTHGQVLSSTSLDNTADFVSGPSDFEMALGNGQADMCSLPLQDLIHDSVISNSPVATVNTPNMVSLSTAWFNRLSPSSPSQNLLMSSLASLPSPPPSATMDTSALFMPPPTQQQQQQQQQRQLHQPFSQQSVSAQLASGPMTMAPDAFMIKPQNSAGTRPPIQTTTNEHPSSRNSLKIEGNNMGLSRWLLQVHDVPRKSRTETQVKLRVQLVDVSASASPYPDGSTGEPVTQYSHILVPNTPSVKTKTRGVGDPDPSALLTLHAYIVCATVPEYQNKPVPCCESCQKRERNRNSKKKTGAGTASLKGRSAASSKNVTPATSTNATPATSDAEMYSAPSGSHAHAYPFQREGFEEAGEGYVSPIDFTCNRLVDFSSGTASLSFRIVCYCRHYKEKNGFCVQLQLRDSANRVVGKVKTTPIMIMDDHKSVSKLTPAHTADEEEVDTGAAKRRTKRIVARYSESEARIKEEDGDDFEEGGVGAIRNKHRLSRHSVLSQSAGSLTKLTSSKPVSASVNGPTISNAPSTSRSGPGHAHRHSQSYTHSESPLPTTAPSSPSVGFSPQPSHATGDTGAKSEAELNAFAPLQPFGSSIPLSANDNLLLNNPLMQAMPSVNMALSGMTLSSPATAMAPQPNPFPHITRVMPASGPVQGGIEITLLGANFSPEALTTACIAFGENIVPFGPTVQIFSNSALICSLPPRSVAGPVEVKLVGVREMAPGVASPAPIFTYTDEGDKDLMIHALQILGWQNSGQWQDPRSVAMGILGGGGSGGGMSGLMQSDADMGFGGGGFTFAAANRNGVNVRGPHQATQPGGRRNVEALVLNVLRSARNPETDTINHLSAPHPATGQTILHRACALGYQTLVSALIGWGADVDLTDKNGFTPVHFACFYGHLKCIDILVRQGRAHLEGRDHQGRTPLDVCGTEGAIEVIRDLEEEVETRRRRSTAPSEIESGGEGDDEGLSWSEADDDEEEEEPPKPASRRISRVNSVASIVSNRRLAKSTTPFAPEPFTAIHPSVSAHPSAPVAAPTRQPWWSMPLPGRGGATATPVPEKFLKSSAEASQTEQEQMFRWFREMRESWTIWRQQQQQQLDLEPPPSYTPSDPVSKLHLIAHEKVTTGAAGTPAVPTELEEPPSPLSLDSQFEHVPTRTISRSTSNIRLRQQQIVYRRRADREVLGEQPQMHAADVGPRRAAKKRDTMLIYFWIPVLLAVFVWMTYKSVGLVYRSFTSHPLMQNSAAFIQETV